MTNNPELIEKVIERIKKLSEKDLEKIIKEADEFCENRPKIKIVHSNEMEMIVAVAIRTNEGEILVSRHCHAELLVMYPEKFKYAEQGFLTSKCRFVNRKEALEIAKKHNKLNRLVDNDELYSEDIFLNEKR